MADHYYSAPSGDVFVTWVWDAKRQHWIAHGRVGGVVPVERVEAYAAAPTDRRSTFTGSGLPFPHEHFGQGQGPMPVALGPGGTFEVDIMEPNSWHDINGVLRGPELRLTVWRTGSRGPEVNRVPLPNIARIPSRSLTYLHKMDPVAFNDDIVRYESRSQEEVLRASAYPRKDHEAIFT